MSASDRTRTRPEEDSSSEDDEPQNPTSSTHTHVPQGKYRSRVDEYADKASFPTEPLYRVGEVVYLVVPGQSQPLGPYQIVSSDFASSTYVIKRVDNGVTYPASVLESSLRVLVPT
ncbi:hypothetical protein V8F06_006158 [Rhypophila decipiens]